MQHKYHHDHAPSERPADCPACNEADPRDPENTRPGIFRNHNCTYCDNGKKDCLVGLPSWCPHPHARND